ncbi:hypothetical protein Sjap_009373 [Stephania japonica]|uniref:Uncharacterized protein n=1 Tax=Stephania japonica TaxID=461633 RepID=A0AAP0JRV2_9MAGN
MPTLFPNIRELKITRSAIAVVMMLGDRRQLYLSNITCYISRVSDLIELPHQRYYLRTSNLENVENKEGAESEI